MFCAPNPCHIHDLPRRIARPDRARCRCPGRSASFPAKAMLAKALVPPHLLTQRRRLVRRKTSLTFIEVTVHLSPAWNRHTRQAHLRGHLHHTARAAQLRIHRLACQHISRAQKISVACSDWRTWRRFECTPLQCQFSIVVPACFFLRERPVKNTSTKLRQAPRARRQPP